MHAYTGVQLSIQVILLQSLLSLNGTVRHRSDASQSTCEGAKDIGTLEVESRMSVGLNFLQTNKVEETVEVTPWKRATGRRNSGGNLTWGEGTGLVINLNSQ